MKKIARCFLFFLVLASFISNSRACGCIGGSTAEYFKDADVVFLGTVEEVVDLRAKTHSAIRAGSDPVFAVIRITASWKGIEYQRTVIVRTVESGATCGVEFEVGQEFLVFARVDKPMDPFYRPTDKWERDYISFFETHLCSGTAEKRYAINALKNLGEPFYRFAVCPHCDGTGWVDDPVVDATKLGLPAIPAHKTWCRVCDGTGGVTIRKRSP